MHIAKISTMNFYGNRATMIRDAAKNADKKANSFVEEIFKPVDDFVNYNQSSYSVPTGHNPLEQAKIKRYPFRPDDNPVSKEYLKVKEEVNKPVEEVVDFVSESSIIK